MDRREFHTLDGLRGVAALAVFTLHAAALMFPLAAPSAYLAVDLFFLLSGFVIEHAYGERLRGPLSPRRFFVQRLLRFYPLYLLGTVIGILSAGMALVLGQGELDLVGFSAGVVSSLMMLPTPVFDQGGGAFPMNSPGWSLFFELVVNVAFALIARRTSVRVLTAIILASGALLALSIVAFGTADLGAAWPGLVGGFPRVAFSFFLGVLLRRLHRGARKRSLVAFLPLLALPVIFAASPHDPRVFSVVCIALVFPAIIFIGSDFEPPAWALPSFRMLGRISFPLYAIHFPIVILAMRAQTIFGLPHGAYAPWTGLALAGALCGASLLLIRFYDEPVRRFLGGLRLGRKVASA